MLNHLAKLELARKEALKKSVEIRKLQKKPLLQRKFSISSQSGDLGIKKDSKRILKPSMLINRRPSISIADKILSTRVNNGQRALEQQLIFIRFNVFRIYVCILSFFNSLIVKFGAQEENCASKPNAETNAESNETLAKEKRGFERTNTFGYVNSQSYRECDNIGSTVVTKNLPKSNIIAETSFNVTK